MKWPNLYRVRLVLIGVVPALVLGVGGRVKADYVFGERIHLGPAINSSADDGQPSISADGLSLFFHSERSGGYGGRDIWVAERATENENWATPENVGPPVNTSDQDSSPDISPDGLTLYFDSDRPGGSGLSDIWVTTRTTRSDPWGTPVNLGPSVNSSSYDAYPSISADGLTLFMHSNRPGGYGGYDIWMTTRQSKDDPWTTPVNLGPNVNSSAIDSDPCISRDGLVLFFTSLRPGGHSVADMYLLRRTTTQDSWGPPVNLGPILNSSPSGQGNASISADGLTLYFASGRPGGQGDWDLWQAPIKPVVDLNRDGKVDSDDVCFMVDYWGTNEPLFDIGPMPWGDGVVDVQDLLVLAEHLFTYPGAVACWKLDETEGAIAHDSAGNYDGALTGDPVWQPDAGMVAGALEFDGVDDYADIDPVLNPADGPFSVVAWVKGGAPGQVLLSQVGGASWLCMDLVDGCLMTELKGTGRSASSLRSETNITDEAWHEVGLVWDGSYRRLYIDQVEVARDAAALPAMEGSEGGLYLGVGRTLAPDTFFSGLIDELRIYSVALEL